MAEAARIATGPALPDGIDELVLPVGLPTNVQVDGRFRVEEVTSDLYNISGRLREECGPEFFILIREDREFGAKAFTIMRRTDRGEEFVFNCTRLDGRVIEHVQYLMKVPLEHRFEAACKIIDREEAEAHENEKDELTEKLGLPMVRELQRCGFIDSVGGFQPKPRHFGRGR